MKYDVIYKQQAYFDLNQLHSFFVLFLVSILYGLVWQRIHYDIIHFLGPRFIPHVTILKRERGRELLFVQYMTTMTCINRYT